MRFQDLPIKRKLVGVILLTSLSVLILTCLALLTFEAFSYRASTKRSLETLGDMLAANSTTALFYDDKSVAQENLNALRAEPEISAAAFYDKDGHLYATYPTNRSRSEFPSRPEAPGMRFRSGQLTLVQSVTEGNSLAGTLLLQWDVRGMYRRLGVYALVLVAVFAGSGVIALVLSNVFQKRISEPLLSLGATAKVVSEKRDYSLRAKKTSNDEIGELTDAFNSMLDQIEGSHSALKESEARLSKALRAKDSFLAMLSHELRTPLNPVLLLASEAASHPKTPVELKSVFETICRNVELEARLIDDLLDLTRIAGGKMVLDLKPRDVHRILRDTVAILASEIAEGGLHLRLRLAAPRTTVLADSVRLQQVFWNLLKNAVKFSHRGGEITVETRSSEDHVGIIIEITDSGIGMTSDEIQRLFRVFSQGDHASSAGASRFGGVGLGLAIARNLVDLQRGSIRASSPGRGRGSTFTIELPLLANVEPAESAGFGTPGPDAEHAAAAGPSAPRRILLVEDHEPTREALARLLRRRKFDVVVAASLGEARILAEEQHFDLLISDIGLPDGNGYDLMSQLRDREGLKGIALTGYGMEEDVARSREAGFFAHLTKPVRAQTLDQVILEATRTQ
jgi:signal transduction histidine kinase/CheY-like chemotaxis protein